MKIIIPLIAMISLLTGCAQLAMPSAAQMKALANDTNMIHLSIQTLYGSVVLDRNIHQTP